MNISHRFEREPFVRANRGIVGCEWFIYRKMELCHWLVHGNVKNNRIKKLNEKLSLIP